MIANIRRLVVLCTVLTGFVPSTRAQVDSIDHGPMVLSIARLTGLPLYPGQNSDVAMGYLWLDQLMRTTSETNVYTYLSRLENADTAKFLASAFYRMVDDNPVSFFQWERGLQGYRARAGYLRGIAERFIGRALSDPISVAALLGSDLILRVTANDTQSSVSNEGLPRMVLVTSEIVEVIKGQQVPMCPANMKVGSKSHNILAYRNPELTAAIPATSNTCVQFQYSPVVSRKSSLTLLGGDVPELGLLSDSTGDWIHTGEDYIVFLRFMGEGSDSTHNYFSTLSGFFGNNGGIYRVVNGRVEDPYDDFGFGSTSLSAEEWEGKLRGRIVQITQ